MLRQMLLGKIHRAMVTGAELHYEGSVTVDEDLLELSGILAYERVDIWNVTTGERGSGVVCINGAAAHKARKGDLVIIAAFAEMEEEQARSWVPRAVFVDE